MKITHNKAQIAVKWANGQWSYYPTKKGRKIEAIRQNLLKSSNFDFAIVYAMSDSWKMSQPMAIRGAKLYKITPTGVITY